MVKDFFVSFKENLQTKSSNPFLGTYVIIWCIRHWELVYSFFFFDAKSTRTEKIKIISDYYADKNLVEDILINIGIALIVLIVTYSLMNLSRFIVDIFEKKVKPWVSKFTDKNSIVLKEVHDAVKTEKNDLEIKLEKEREAKGKLQKEISDLETKIDELYKEKAEREAKPKQEKEAESAIDNLEKPAISKSKKSKTNIEPQQQQAQEIEIPDIPPEELMDIGNENVIGEEQAIQTEEEPQNILSQNEVDELLKAVEKPTDKKVEILYNKLQSDNLANEFRYVALKIADKKNIAKNKNIPYLLEMELVGYNQKQTAHILTELGQKVLEKIDRESK